MKAEHSRPRSSPVMPMRLGLRRVKKELAECEMQSGISPEDFDLDDVDKVEVQACKHKVCEEPKKGDIANQPTLPIDEEGDLVDPQGNKVDPSGSAAGGVVGGAVGVLALG